MYKYFVLFDFICLILIYFVCLLPRWKSNKKDLFLKSCFYIYLCFVLYFTLMPFVLPIPFINFQLSSANINLIPFIDFLQGHGGAGKEFLLNVMMMIPFGIFVAFIYRKKFLSTIKHTFLFSLMIEVFQIFSNGGLRSFDSTDLISNTLGGMGGYFLYRLFCPFATALLNKLFLENNVKAEKPPKATKREIVIFGIIAAQILVRSILIAYL